MGIFTFLSLPPHYKCLYQKGHPRIVTEVDMFVLYSYVQYYQFAINDP